MARRRRYARSASAKWLAGVLVAVLAIVTILLVVFAIERVSTAPTGDGPEPVPSFSFGSAASATPSSTPEPAPAAPPPAPPDAAAERFLSIGSGAMWRGTAGDCGVSAPTIERSDDAGATWVDVTPTYRQIGQLSSLAAFAGAEAEIVASMGANCETQALRTFTQGEFWEPYPDVLASSRYLDPANPASVVTPAGPVAAPCAAPSSLRALGGVVALVCDGTASVLVDGAWVALATTDVAALDVADGTVVVAAVAAGCDGLQVTRWSSADLAVSEAVGCVVGARAPVAVAATAATVLVWSGDGLLAP